ncbi:LysR family transcriptional regulator [Roseovarius phycicola]|uniref:LysR family transcriptional regulator n=1 Tax=Roseovarius phycicola TaxID=3080976 RepID=A0ABZ2HEG5_9RHOB
MAERLEIDAMRALCAIGTSGGVTNAARQLGLSQSAVSHKIKRLESALDCALLARQSGGPLFTDAGKRLHDYALRIINLHDEALSDLGKKNLNGAIRLGMTEDATTSDIAGILGRFTRLYPSVSVRTRTSQSLNVQAWLQADELDLAMMQVFTTDIEPQDQALFDDTLHWVKSKDYELDLARPIPFLSFDTNCFYRKWGFSEVLQEGRSFEKVLECPSAAGIQSGVRSGLGIALLNGMHVTEDMDVIENLFPSPPSITFVARVNPKSRSAPVKALVSEIAREFRVPASLSAAE